MQATINKRFRKVKLITILAIFQIVLFTAVGQNSINAGGGNCDGLGGSSSYSLGQVSYSYFSSKDSTNISSEGVQQLFDIFLTAGDIKLNNVIDFSVTAYPNPVVDNICLSISADVTKNKFVATLFDTKGEIVFVQPVTENQTIINMKELQASLFILKITKNNGEEPSSYITYKIIKK